MQVFQLFGASYSAREIADQFHLSAKTVETHCEKIKHKLSSAQRQLNSSNSPGNGLPKTWCLLSHGRDNSIRKFKGDRGRLVIFNSYSPNGES